MNKEALVETAAALCKAISDAMLEVFDGLLRGLRTSKRTAQIEQGVEDPTAASWPGPCGKPGHYRNIAGFGYSESALAGETLRIRVEAAEPEVGGPGR
jgi:hypothetical protein